jgi:two-component system chemotaxis response regulator CheB
LEALTRLLPDIPADIPAALFIVLHMPAQNPGLLPQILSRYSSLAVNPVVNGEPVKPGHIYVAAPDYHLIIESGKVHLLRGPRENRHRPAVDVLFRSAALAYGPRVTGVVLTGALDDGTAGLFAIKRRGGMAVIQDPKDALFSSMPQNAAENVQIDFAVPLTEMGPLLARLAYQEAPAAQKFPAPQEMQKEGRIMDLDMNTLNNDDKIGTPSVFSCPECHGVLWELHDGDLTRYRCRVGHAFSPESMAAEQSEALETALWMALKTLEESASLSRRMVERARQRGQPAIANRFAQREQDALERAQLIHDVLVKSETSVERESNEVLNIPPEPEAEDKAS